MDASHTNNKLTTTLERFSKATTDLLSSLQKENQLLNQQDVTALQEFSATKTEKLVTFEKSQFALLETLAITDLAQLPTVLDTRMNELPENEKQQAKDLWKHIIELLKECSHVNKVNGGIVQKNLQVTRRKIDILTQKDVSTQTYDEKGNL